MDEHVMALHDHIHQKKVAKLLFPLKSHLIFGFSALQKLLVCLQNGSVDSYVDPKNARKHRKYLFFSSLPYLF